MFRRRQGKETVAAAAREADRRALFAQLAERPENICPFLGLDGNRIGYVDGPSDEHRCFAFGDPAPLSAEQQTRVCQDRGYGNCPRYLRGVLVIPSEELDALRRPRPAAAPAAPPSTRSRRRAPLIALAVLLAVAALGAVGLLAMTGGDPVAAPSVTPIPTAAATAEPTAEPTAAPPTTAPTPTPAATPAPTRTPDPTPIPADVFAFYEVQVEPGSYVLYQVSESGELTSSRDAAFNDRSQARVDRVETPNGLHWRTAEGQDYLGWSYVWPNSGGFEIWAVYTRADGGRSSERLPDDQL